MLGDTHQHRHQRQQHDYRRIEVITGERRRRQWSDAEKALIVAESFVPEANISSVARRNGVSGGLLFKWRRDASRMAAVKFVPITLSAPIPREDDASGAYGTIEVALAGARLFVHGVVCKAAPDPSSVQRKTTPSGLSIVACTPTCRPDHG